MKKLDDVREEVRSHLMATLTDEMIQDAIPGWWWSIRLFLHGRAQTLETVRQSIYDYSAAYWREWLVARHPFDGLVHQTPVFCPTCRRYAPCPVFQALRGDNVDLSDVVL